MKRAYGYTRSAVRETSDIQLQTIRINDYCKTTGLKLIEVFTDSNKSGRKPFQNNALDEMLSRCRKKDKINEIVITSWDRLSKDQYDQYLITEILGRKGIKLSVLNELTNEYQETKVAITNNKNL